MCVQDCYRGHRFFGHSGHCFKNVTALAASRMLLLSAASGMLSLLPNLLGYRYRCFKNFIVGSWHRFKNVSAVRRRMLLHCCRCHRYKNVTAVFASTRLPLPLPPFLITRSLTAVTVPIEGCRCHRHPAAPAVAAQDWPQECHGCPRFNKVDAVTASTLLPLSPLLEFCRCHRFFPAIALATTRIVTCFKNALSPLLNSLGLSLLMSPLSRLQPLSQLQESKCCCVSKLLPL